MNLLKRCEQKCHNIVRFGRHQPRDKLLFKTTIFYCWPRNWSALTPQYKMPLYHPKTLVRTCCLPLSLSLPDLHILFTLALPGWCLCTVISSVTCHWGHGPHHAGTNLTQPLIFFLHPLFTLFTLFSCMSLIWCVYSDKRICAFVHIWVSVFRVVVLESRPTDNPTAFSNLYILAGHENSY